MKDNFGVLDHAGRWLFFHYLHWISLNAMSGDRSIVWLHDVLQWTVLVICCRNVVHAICVVSWRNISNSCSQSFLMLVHVAQTVGDRNPIYSYFAGSMFNRPWCLISCRLYACNWREVLQNILYNITSEKKNNLGDALPKVIHFCIHATHLLFLMTREGEGGREVWIEGRGE